jgi:trehalose-6-phosphate synthase
MNPSDRDHMAQSMYRAAEMTNLAGNRREARALVDRIAESFPYSQWAEEGRKLLENE